MTSRLDRLFLLLETGSTPLVRKSAALQIGDVQKLHPHELDNLLTKTLVYLQSPAWETRIAASQAIEAIVSNVPLWFPSGQHRLDSANSPADWHDLNERQRLAFSLYNVENILNCGYALFQCEEKDPLTEAGSSNQDPNELLSTQKKNVYQSLNLTVGNKCILDVDIVQEQDFTVNPLQPRVNRSDRTRLNAVLHTASRIRTNKRKSSTSEEETSKRIKVEVKNEIKDEPSEDDIVAECSTQNSSEISNQWPLDWFCRRLMDDLLSPDWEKRHGAATGLREILRLQGRCGGRCQNAPQSEMERLNQEWLEDLALQLITVLAVDRFGDFVGDQVVAMVRETSAQTLGLVLQLFTSERVESTVRILLDLLKSTKWEARHGGMLGMKYLLVIRRDMIGVILPNVFEAIFNGLNDSIDDVSAVAAATLVPVKDELMNFLPEKVPIIVSYLWDALLVLDDLAACTGDLLMLLSSLLSFKGLETTDHNLNYEDGQLKTLIPRLWLFISNGSSSVRKSVLNSLLILCEKTSSDWLDKELLSDALRLLFQRSLLESNTTILEMIFNVWKCLVTKAPYMTVVEATCGHIGGWLGLMNHSSKSEIIPALYPVWFHVQRPQSNINGHFIESYASGALYIGGFTLSDPVEERERCANKARYQCSRMMGILAYHINYRDPNVSQAIFDEIVSAFATALLFFLNSKFGTNKMTMGWIIKEWGIYKMQREGDSIPLWLKPEGSNAAPLAPLGLSKSLADKCLEVTRESIYYDELRTDFSQIQSQALDLLNILRTNKVEFNDIYAHVKYFFVPQIMTLTDEISTKILPEMRKQHQSAKKPTKKVESLIQTLDSHSTVLRNNAEEFTKRNLALKMSLCSSQACALISWNELPEKLSPIICPIMETIEKENVEQLQRIASSSLVQLLRLCCERIMGGSLRANPIPKIIRNLISFACADRTFTPEVTLNLTESTNQQSEQTPNSQMGIISLKNIEKNIEKSRILRRGNSVTAKQKQCAGDSEQEKNITDPELDKSREVARRGAVIVLGEICDFFGVNVSRQIPTLWAHLQNLTTGMDLPEFNDAGVVKAKELVTSLQVLELVGPHIHPELQVNLKDSFGFLAKCLDSPFVSVRHMAARCFGMLAKTLPNVCIEFVLNKILDMLNSSDCEIRRQGAIETLYFIVECLSLEIVPYIVFFIVPMLGRMADQNENVRQLATHCFAQLVQLMPLDNDKNIDVVKKENPSEDVFKRFTLTPEMLERKKNERHFLEQLTDIKRLDNYALPIEVSAELRTYQQDGLNWLAFLNKYKLHGIVADEMGLGKTLQAICILASEQHLALTRFLSGESQNRPLPSIVICPPTLTGHWLYEINKFVSKKYLSSVVYSGPPVERAALREIIKRAFASTPKTSTKAKTNLVIASYDLVRNDIDFFSAIQWNYCILDEGHVIKNGKTKLSKAIKSLRANHRLILTGTPIQNNVEELWSLFDFLIPGFLGTEKQFAVQYAKPIILSREAKSSSKEQEAGVMAMEKLHRQVLPFVLRRMKEDVLQDLPPKIIQDYYCELSPLQSLLYEDFAKSRAKESLGEDFTAEMGDLMEHNSKKISHSHVFQSLQYLRKVCNHPKLALTPSHPRYDFFMSQLKKDNTDLSDINNAAKLCALKQLLLDCGIGATAVNSSNGNAGQTTTVPVVNQHRALIFCQLKSMLNIIENDLLKRHMKTVSYMRLDGDVPAASRFSIVHKFNNDPSIDILLLTTQVGGLGLNLTGADTVIFVEHDWNPTKDLQAMDRAHRIGQKKVVNVYRLITSRTLEEKIMGLQKFKLNIANTVISSENSHLDSMGTDQLLDLFEFRSQNSESSSSKSSADGGDGSRKVSMKSFLENLPELWDTEHYESEYDIKNFMQSLKQ